jgi:ATP-binding cassette, subfamily B, bacterial
MNELVWPASRLGEALGSLVAASEPAPPSAHVIGNPESLSEWLTTAARTLNAEVQSAETTYTAFDKEAAAMAPALIQVPGQQGFLVLVAGRRLTVLCPDGSKHHVSPQAIRSMLCSEREQSVRAEVQSVLDRARIELAAQARAREALISERMSSARIGGIWLVRLPPSANFWQQLRQSGVQRRLIALTGAHTVQYLLWIFAWWVVGSNVLNRSSDRSWLYLWALLLLTLVPIRVLITWLQGSVAIRGGARLKERLFTGALKVEPDSIRHQGAGQLLGRVLESEAVESLALSGGFLALMAIVELFISIFVLAAGAGGWRQAGVLVAWLAVGDVIGLQYMRRNRFWTDVRLNMTHELIENMVGHRTRLAQLPPDRWHQGEDEALEGYLKASKAMDDFTAALLAIIPRGWLVLGMIALIPAFVGGASTASIGIAVGGVLLAYRALRRRTSGAWQLAGAWVAWQRASVLFEAAKKPETIGALEAAGSVTDGTLHARDLSFRYNEKAPHVLRGCSLTVGAGERIVLEGASGGGKSTLVSLIAGLRDPASGEVLVSGLDRKRLGDDAWRKHVAVAPQFHENHVLAETFAFNLMMGRHKLPSRHDMPEAEAVCRELGLGDLLNRMPSGLLQMVGETGWQLSHGERSRLYIARALLQDADLVILDESFAALDPMNFQIALDCAVKRARSLLVIAHR